MEENRELAGKMEWYETVSFQDAKAIIRANLTSAARSFIAIGFYLKHIRDQELYCEGGFETIWDFAQAEYGISKSTASRYMSMNDHFSQGGNSPVIQDKYRQFNKSQLQEMLSLNEEQLERITPADRVEALLSCFVLALHEEFGFGKERCLRALYRRVNHARPYLADVIAWQPLPEPYRPGKER